MKKIVFIFIILIYINKTYGQWTLVDGITSRTSTIHYKNPCIYIDKFAYPEAGSMHFSCNNSDSFSQSTNIGIPFSIYSIRDIDNYGDTLFCVTYNVLYISTDMGNTWDTFITFDGVSIHDPYNLFIYEKLLIYLL
jgi:hypothetical protein